MFSATMCYNVFKIFILYHYYPIWINMIQTKKIAILMIAIATVAVVGSAGLLVHVNADPGKGNGATVTKGVKCGGGGQFPPGVTGTGHVVVTPSGNAILSCHST